jgi:uncharacterized membrane protein
VGGPATAAAMASARGWAAAVQPAIVVGTVGYAIGTPIGCLGGERSEIVVLALSSIE